tara:strand:- start:400 stop:681 length:282 start_codon:yes stop_codon:yes gene_type:complete
MSKSKILKITLDGETHTCDIASDETILDTALDKDIDIPFSCQSGVCTACQAKVNLGTVKMDVSDGLSDEEIEENYILCCQAYVTSDLIEIEID